MAPGAVAQLVEAGDVVGEENLGAAGGEVLELARQDGGAALGLLVEVRARTAAAHRSLLELDDAQPGDLRQQPVGRTALGAADGIGAWLVIGHRPAQASQGGVHPGVGEEARGMPNRPADPATPRLIPGLLAYQPPP